MSPFISKIFHLNGIILRTRIKRCAQPKEDNHDYPILATERQAAWYLQLIK